MHEIFLVGKFLPSSQDQEQFQPLVQCSHFKTTQNFTEYSQKIIGNPMITPDTEDVHFRGDYRLVGK